MVVVVVLVDVLGRVGLVAVVGRRVVTGIQHNQCEIFNHMEDTITRNQQKGPFRMSPNTLVFMMTIYQVSSSKCLSW